MKRLCFAGVITPWQLGEVDDAGSRWVYCRFLLHILPAGFRKIRHYGLFASRNKGNCLAVCRRFTSTLQPARELPPLTLLQTWTFFQRTAQPFQMLIYAWNLNPVGRGKVCAFYPIICVICVYSNTNGTLLSINLLIHETYFPHGFYFYFRGFVQANYWISFLLCATLGRFFATSNNSLFIIGTFR